MDAPQVIVVGGGGTGGAFAHDLVLRGLAVTLLERGELTSGTTGRHHGLRLSGARYAVNDPESAVDGAMWWPEYVPYLPAHPTERRRSTET